MSNENRKAIIFTKDFATKKVGEVFICDRTLARDIVNEGVAKYHEEKAPETSEEVSKTITAKKVKK